MIAVLEWVDGFGEDTRVAGIFSSLDKARETFKEQAYNKYEEQLRFVNFCIDKELDEPFDWYEAEKLFPKKFLKFY